MLIQDPANVRLLSMASLWEMAIKISQGRLSLAQPFAVLIPQQLERNDTNVLDITFAHVVAVSRLPFHHRDPFDRLLIAQSMVKGLPLLSADHVFDAYGINHIW